MSREFLQELDVAHDLKTVAIPCETMAKLAKALREEPPCPAFVCLICGKTRRDPSVIDPGLLHNPRTCTIAGMSCNDTECEYTPTPIEFRPGSLVLARLNPSTTWPAIVEFSTDEIGDYCLRRSIEARPYAYYITFIRLLDPRGGWFSPHSLSPLKPATERFPDLYYCGLWDPMDALRHCQWYLKHGTLRDRLLKLSWIASQLRNEGFQIDEITTAKSVEEAPGGAKKSRSRSPPNSPRPSKRQRTIR